MRQCASFEEIARQELPVMLRVARRLALDATEAEDLVGQALLDATAGWPRFDGRHPRSWLLRILRNRFLQSRRRTAPPPVDLAPDLRGSESWSSIDWRLVGPELSVQLDALPEEYRLAVALCDVEEMPYGEAAAILECNLNTLKSRLFRGRRMLRASLAHLAEEAGR